MGKRDSKWLQCFRRSPTIEIDTAVDCSANRVLTYIAAVKKKSYKEMMKKKMKRKEKKTQSSSSHEANDFSAFMKAAFSGRTACSSSSTSMSSKAVQVTEPQQNRSRDKLPLQLEESNDSSGKESSSSLLCLDWNKDTGFSEIAATRNEMKTTDENLPGSSVPEDSQIDFLLPNGKRRRNQGRQGRQNFRDSETTFLSSCSSVRMNHVLCLLLFSLWMTVFWGKILAVMTTTVGIYVWERKRTTTRRHLMSSMIMAVPVNGGGCRLEKIRESHE